jgi:hypothetical protein
VGSIKFFAAAMRRRGRSGARQLAARIGACMALLVVAGAAAQPALPSFSLDDNPQFPIIGFFGFGLGAENPGGLPAVGFPPGLAPSPTLALMPNLVYGDGDVLTYGFPTPTLLMPGLAYYYLSSLSINNAGDPEFPIYLCFSVDRLTTGLAGSAVLNQSTLNQQPADIFKTAGVYWQPTLYRGTLAVQPFAGYLGSFLAGPPANPQSNTLLLDQSNFPLRVYGTPGNPTIAFAPAQQGTHDNIDAWEMLPIRSPLSGPAFITGLWSYVTVYPDWALLAGFLPTDIFAIPPNSVAATPPAWAQAAAMGLSPFDAIDALEVWDAAPLGGTAQPTIDCALFSLAPGSATLVALGLSAGDILYTDFSGAFAVYAYAFEIGVTWQGGGAIGADDNVDAIDFICAGDVNNDGIVEVTDLQIVLAAFGTPAGDLTFDGNTDALDLWVVMQTYGCTS